jgi:hypothetical protein
MAEMNRFCHNLFFNKAGISATETLELVQKAYGKEAMNRSNVFEGYSRFQDERELVEDEERGGRPKSTRTEVNIAAVADLVKNDSRIFEHSHDCSSSDSERGFGKEKVVCTKILHQDRVDKFFRLLRRSAQRILTRGIAINAERYVSSSCVFDF